jgi:hypothetical protein
VTLLFIGGLLVIAILAILGAVFLGFSDQRAEKARSNGEVILTQTSNRPLIEQQPAGNRAQAQTVPIRQGIPASTEQRMVSTEESQQAYALNGQFHELSVELQTLHQHASELERRLRTLAEVADRIEKTPGDQIITEGERYTQSPVDSTK